MSLRPYEGEWVLLTNTDGQTYKGYASDYIFPEDNYPEEVEGIILNKPIRGDGYVYNRSVEFAAPEISAIEIVERH